MSGGEGGVPEGGVIGLVVAGGWVDLQHTCPVPHPGAFSTLAGGHVAGIAGMQL
jgi:hypothetical protein